MGRVKKFCGRGQSHAHRGELHIEGFHAQHGMAHAAQEFHQLLGIVGADGLIGNHVGEVVHAVQLLGGSIQTLPHLVLQLLGHPDDTAGAAFCLDELLGGDELLAVAHEAGGLNAAAGHGSHLGEAHAQGGHAGVLTAGDNHMYGIPEFRLPKALVQKEIDNIRKLGVKIVTNAVVGRAMTVEELLEEGNDAVFVGSGAGLPNFQKIPGESLCGVYSANEFLTRINLMRAYTFPEHDTPVKVGQRVAVIGGGNVAMDAARCARRLGADVSIVYRRSEAEMPARKEEVHHAKEEGIHFRMLTNPKAILGDENGFVRAMTCVEMELGEPDERGRRRPVPKPGSEFELPVETVVVAIGNSPNPLIKKTTPDLPTETWGGITTDEHGRTGKKHVYAGGDAVTGAATVILAMGAGKKAAQAILEDAAKEE